MSLPPDIERVALLGWVLYPVSTTSKAGCFKGAADAATCHLDTLERWAREYRGCGWRVVCGPSRLFALDVDRLGTHHHDGFAALAALTRKHGPLPPRPMTRTGGSGGAALFFRHDGQRLRGQSGLPAPGIDPHRGRQAVMLPPSRHPVTGGSYIWRVAPWDLEPPPIPTWLTKLLEMPADPVATHPFLPTHERALRAVMRAIHTVQDAPSGAANDTLNRAAFSLGRWCSAGLVANQDAEATLLSAARMRHIPEREARDTIKSGLKAGLRNPVQARNVG